MSLGDSAKMWCRPSTSCTATAVLLTLALHLEGTRLSRHSWPTQAVPFDMVRDQTDAALETIRLATPIRRANASADRRGHIRGRCSGLLASRAREAQRGYRRATPKRVG